MKAELPVWETGTGLNDLHEGRDLSLDIVTVS